MDGEETFHDIGKIRQATFLAVSEDFIIRLLVILIHFVP